MKQSAWRLSNNSKNGYYKSEILDSIPVNSQEMILILSDSLSAQYFTPQLTEIWAGKRGVLS